MGHAAASTSGGLDAEDNPEDPRSEISGTAEVDPQLPEDHSPDTSARAHHHEESADRTPERDAQSLRSRSPCGYRFLSMKAIRTETVRSQLFSR